MLFCALCKHAEEEHDKELGFCRNKTGPDRCLCPWFVKHENIKGIEGREVSESEAN